MYIIRGADQNQYGPVTADVLRQWMAERRVDAQTLARTEESSEWKPLGSFPELQTDPPLLAALTPGRPERNGLAVASLILGVAGLVCLGPIAGIPALLLGIIALSRSKRQPGQGTNNGFAIAGIALGVASFVFVFILAGIFLPTWAKVRDRARSVQCMSNLKQLGVGTLIYANDHGGAFPDDLTQLRGMGFEPRVLWCPSDTTKSPATSWDDLTSDNISYSWQGAGFRDDRYPQRIIAYCPIHGHVLQTDGAVIPISTRR